MSILTGPLWAQVVAPKLLITGGLELRAGVSTVSLLRPAKVSGSTALPAPGLTERRVFSMAAGGGAGDGAAYGGGYYVNHLGIFCKEELRMENTLHVPLRLRLGSLQEVNRMEGKPGW